MKDSNRLVYLMTGDMPNNISPVLPIVKSNWQPYPWSKKQVDFHKILMEPPQSIGSPLSDIQKLLFKIALKYQLSIKDKQIIQNWIISGNLIMDDDPKVFIFNLGKRSGKTYLSTRIALARSSVGQSAVYFCRDSGGIGVMANYLGKITPSIPWTGQVYPMNRANLIGIQDGHYIVDDHEHDIDSRFDALSNRGESLVIIGTFGENRKIYIPDNIPTLALTLNTRIVRNSDYFDHFVPVQQLPSSKLLCHKFNQTFIRSV